MKDRLHTSKQSTTNRLLCAGIGQQTRNHHVNTGLGLILTRIPRRKRLLHHIHISDVLDHQILGNLGHICLDKRLRVLTSMKRSGMLTLVVQIEINAKRRNPLRQLLKQRGRRIRHVDILAVEAAKLLHIFG